MRRAPLLIQHRGPASLPLMKQSRPPTPNTKPEPRDVTILVTVMDHSDVHCRTEGPSDGVDGDGPDARLRW